MHKNLIENRQRSKTLPISIETKENDNNLQNTYNLYDLINGTDVLTPRNNSNMSNLSISPIDSDDESLDTSVVFHLQDSPWMRNKKKIKRTMSLDLNHSQDDISFLPSSPYNQSVKKSTSFLNNIILSPRIKLKNSSSNLNKRKHSNSYNIFHPSPNLKFEKEKINKSKEKRPSLLSSLLELEKTNDSNLNISNDSWINSNLPSEDNINYINYNNNDIKDMTTKEFLIDLIKIIKKIDSTININNDDIYNNKIVLRLADDDWTPDYDFPAINYNACLLSKGFGRLVILLNNNNNNNNNDNDLDSSLDNSYDLDSSLDQSYQSHDSIPLIYNNKINFQTIGYVDISFTIPDSAHIRFRLKNNYEVHHILLNKNKIKNDQIYKSYKDSYKKNDSFENASMHITEDNKTIISETENYYQSQEENIFFVDADDWVVEETRAVLRSEKKRRKSQKLIRQYNVLKKNSSELYIRSTTTTIEKDITLSPNSNNINDDLMFLSPPSSPSKRNNYRSPRKGSMLSFKSINNHYGDII